MLDNTKNNSLKSSLQEKIEGNKFNEKLNPISF